MTDRQADDTPQVPSRLSIVIGVLAWWAALITLIWVGMGMETGREFAGFGLGVALALLLMGQVIGRVVDRAYGPVPVRLAAEDDAEELDELAEDQVADQFGPYEEFVPASPWNATTPVYNRPPDKPLPYLYPDARCSSPVPGGRHAAWLAPPTERIELPDAGVTERIDLRPDQRD